MTACLSVILTTVPVMTASSVVSELRGILLRSLLFVKAGESAGEVQIVILRLAGGCRLGGGLELGVSPLRAPQGAKSRSG